MPPGLRNRRRNVPVTATSPFLRSFHMSRHAEERGSGALRPEEGVVVWTWCGMVCCGRGVVWYGLVWSGVDVVWYGVLWTWCRVVWSGLVWCGRGVVWCVVDVVSCGVVWSGRGVVWTWCGMDVHTPARHPDKGGRDAPDTTIDLPQREPATARSQSPRPRSSRPADGRSPLRGCLRIAPIPLCAHR